MNRRRRRSCLGDRPGKFFDGYQIRAHIAAGRQSSRHSTHLFVCLLENHSKYEERERPSSLLYSWPEWIQGSSRGRWWPEILQTLAGSSSPTTESIIIVNVFWPHQLQKLIQRLLKIIRVPSVISIFLCAKDKTHRPASHWSATSDRVSIAVDPSHNEPRRSEGRSWSSSLSILPPSFTITSRSA